MRDVIVILALMGVSFGALTLTSTIVPQLIGIGVLVVARPLFYTAISDYAAKVFGYVPCLSPHSSLFDSYHSLRRSLLHHPSPRLLLPLCHLSLMRS
jgi:hypothetical protein